MNNDKLLTLVMRGRDFDKTRCRVCGWPLKQTVEEGCTTESCSMRPAPQRRADEPPDFSDPSHRDEFFTWLTKERPEMWLNFRHFAFKAWIKDMDATAEFIPWLFFQSPSRPRDLMAEWLRLDETVERFGWVEHHCSHCRKGDVQMHYTHPCEKCGAIGGKIRAEWAKG